MDQITYWNNQAVQLLAEDRIVEAEKTINFAMTTLNRHSKSDVPQQKSCDIRPCRSFSCVSCSRNVEADMYVDESDLIESSIEAVSIGQSDPRTDDPHHALPIYSRAFVVSCTTEESEIGAVLLYNLGLISHKQRDLERAVKLYQLSLQILREKREFNMNELLIMAVLYNLGHAYSQLFLSDKVCTCFNFLRQVLHDTSLEYGEDVLESDEHSFFLNVFLLENNHMTLAPAA